MSARAYFEQDTFAKHLEMELVEHSPGTALVRLPMSARRQNGLGGLHGGLIFTLADVAFAAACNSHEQVAIGVQANITFLTAAKDGPLEARAREVSRRRKLSTYEVRVTDAEERLIASFQGMAYLK